MVRCLPCSQVSGCYIRRHICELILVTDDSVVTADVNHDVSTSVQESTRRCEAGFRYVIIAHLTITRCWIATRCLCIKQAVAYRAQTTAAIDRA